MRVLDFQRMSTEDGPGLRTTLFVKGCPLKCLWCHNPESISRLKQTQWQKVGCIGCLECLKNCKNNALKNSAEGIIVDQNKCIACGTCVDNCPTGSMIIKGVDMSVKSIFDELIKDKPYFGKEGGVTLSGGEIMLQKEEAAQLLKMLKEASIGTAIDTCGLCKKEDFDLIFPYTDVFLYDIKHIDPIKHKEFTGQDNSLILENFNYLSKKIMGTDKQLWVRTPIIPNATDTEENIRGIARFIKDKYTRYDMCAFNNLCKDKYDRLYQKWSFQNAKLMTEKRMNELYNIALNEGIKNVYKSGATRLVEEE